MGDYVYRSVQLVWIHRNSYYLSRNVRLVLKP